jgi:putative flippase GtrA
MWSRAWALLHRGYIIKFLIVGALSFAIDLGTLALLHEVFGLDLWIATPIAFIVSLIFNYSVQRSFTFRSQSRRDVSFLKYVVLVVFNIGATDVIVNAVVGLGISYTVGKIISTILTMVWNFLLYRYWIFRHPRGGRGSGSV